MILEKPSKLNPILFSCKGIHLTAYIVNRGDLLDFNRQLQDAINKASLEISSVMGLRERIKFLAPISSLIGEERILKGFRGNLGIFRTKNSFYALNIPVEVDEICMVATTFHIKPLLRWMQVDREFILLGFEENSVNLYQGSNHSLKQIYSVKLNELIKSNEIIFPLNETINALTKNTGITVFITGENFISDELLQNLEYEKMVRLPFWPFFEQENLDDICLEIRSGLLQESKEALEQSIMDFNYASDLKIANRNIFEVAEAAVNGRVKKLLIAEEVEIFGKLNLKTGGIIINHTDQDHEDDDLLDDIAQTVLARGGEVSIVPREKIPFGRNFLAILEKSGPLLRAKINKKMEMERRVL